MKRIIRRLKKPESNFLADMLSEAIFIPKRHDPLPKEVAKDKSLAKYIKHWGKDKLDIALVWK